MNAIKALGRYILLGLVLLVIYVLIAVVTLFCCLAAVAEWATKPLRRQE